MCELPFFSDWGGEGTVYMTDNMSRGGGEPVWPSGKASGW